MLCERTNQVSAENPRRRDRQQPWKNALIRAAAILIGFTIPVVAQEIDEEALAKQSQNPVANIISIPVEYWSYDGQAGNLNIAIAKPVVPTSLGKYNLINRFIIPYAWVDAGVGGEVPIGPGLVTGIDAPKINISGLTDVTYQGFLSPAAPGKVIWGVGAAVTFPTASEDALGTDRYSAGPSMLLLTIQGRWVLGLLAQNVWDFAGSGDASVNTFTFQPIINYNIANGWYVFSAPIWTANWEAEQKWTIPIGGGVGKLHRFGKLPVDFKLGYYDNVKRPDGSPDSSWLFAVKVLLPTGKK